MLYSLDRFDLFLDFMFVHHHMSLEIRNRFVSFITHCANHIVCYLRETCLHGLSLIRLPKIDISSLREQNPATCLTSRAIHVLTNINDFSLSILTLEVCVLNALPLKTGRAIIHIFSIQSSSMPDFPSFQDLFLYSQGCFWTILILLPKFMQQTPCT